MPTVLIISCSNDTHASHVESALLMTGCDVLRLNTDEMITAPVELVFTTNYRNSICIRGQSRLLSEITSVWYRRPETPQTGVKNLFQRYFAEQETNELLKQLYILLERAYWVSPLSALERARRKIPQLHIALSKGLQIPRTVATNVPAVVEEFVRSCQGRAIYKTLASPVIRPSAKDELWGIPTTILDQSLMTNLGIIRPTGGVFQEYIEKMYEVRVTVIGTKVFSAKIDSQSESTARVDWRDAVARGLVAISPYSLPRLVEDQCRDVVAEYGLAFGAIDLIRALDGSYVFLELNCNGQWLWIEEATQLPLTAALTSNLVGPY